MVKFYQSYLILSRIFKSLSATLCSPHGRNTELSYYNPLCYTNEAITGKVLYSSLMKSILNALTYLIFC